MLSEQPWQLCLSRSPNITSLLTLSLHQRQEVPLQALLSTLQNPQAERHGAALCLLEVGKEGELQKAEHTFVFQKQPTPNGIRGSEHSHHQDEIVIVTL